MRQTALLGVFLFAVVPMAIAQPVLRFKVSPPVTPSAEKTANRAAVQVIAPAAFGGGRHLVVQFDAPPTAATIAELRARGARVLGDVPDNAVLVSAEQGPGQGLDLSGLGVSYAAPLDATVKISPLIQTLGGDNFVVEFHPDVDINDARRIVLSLGLNLQENPDVVAGRLLIGRRTRARAADPLGKLAERDEVSYIFPASPELVAGTPVMACAGAITTNGGIAQLIATVGNGWDGPGLNATSLYYFFSAASTKLPANQAQSEIVRAMNEWSRVVQVAWVPGSSAAGARTVNILFGKGAHGDPYPFDGPGNVLAHTFYPAPPNTEPIAGDMHLDDDEGWRVGANTDLFSVALHELGHALGLGHSDDPTAVMYPYYRMATGLAADDRNAILTLYAAASATPAPSPSPAPTPAPTPTPAPAPTPAPFPTPGPHDVTPPGLTIVNPSTTSLSTSGASRAFSGTAADTGGIASVTWSTNMGYSGTAAGTTSWSIAQVPLVLGINRVTIVAKDLAGNSSWRTVVVTRR